MRDVSRDVGMAVLGVLPFCRGAAFLQAMRAIKDALDPRGILNPGKLVPVAPA